MANVFVSVRLRPMNRKELGNNDVNCILKDHQDERTGLKLQVCKNASAFNQELQLP